MMVFTMKLRSDPEMSATALSFSAMFSQADAPDAAVVGGIGCWRDRAVSSVSPCW